MSKKWTYSSTKAGYAAMWASMTIKSGVDSNNADRFARKIIANEAQYKEVEKLTGVPAFFIGALHMRESSCNFRTHLHNGDPLTARTRHVPAGYPKSGNPPFTWVESAVDALRLKGLQRYKGQWCPSLMGYVSELYNGLGNVAKGVNSAYLWAGSNHEQRGKYVRDHVFDPTFDDPQIGTMTVLKRLCELRPDFAATMKEPTVPKVVKTITKVAVPIGVAEGADQATGGNVTQTATEVATSSIDTLSTFLMFVQNNGTTFAMILGAALIVGTVGYYFWQKRND